MQAISHILAGRDPSVRAADVLFSKLILCNPRVKPDDAENIGRRWLNERAVGEGLCAFLSRQGMLPAEFLESEVLLDDGRLKLSDDELRLCDHDLHGVHFPDMIFAPVGDQAVAGGERPLTEFVIVDRPSGLPELHLARVSVPRLAFPEALNLRMPAPVPAASQELRPRKLDLSPSDSSLTTGYTKPSSRPGGDSSHAGPLRGSKSGAVMRVEVPISDLAPAEVPEPDQPAAVPEKRRPTVGTQLGKCLLTEQVGRGASSVVFRALHKGLNISVAVKVLLLDDLQNGEQIYRLLKSEARLLAQLSHPHIVRVLDFDDEGDHPFLVLEYVEGLSMGELITQSGRLRPDRAARIIQQTAQGLGVAAKLGVIHRDVKPANILLTRDGSAKLADLGLAVVVGERLAGNSNPKSLAEMMVGTATYMSPEQAMSPNSVDHRSDIYSLGVTFYHAVAGRPPFVGRNAMEIMLKHNREQPAPPHTLVPELDRELSDVILKMLAKSPDDRFRTYEELCEALEFLLKPASERLPMEKAPAAEPPAKPVGKKGWRSWFSLFGAKDA